jgi:ribose transport system permease protein
MASRLIRTYTFPVLLLVMCAIFAFSSPVFATDRNAVTVLRQVAPVGMIAVGMTFVILTAGIDLSVGSTVAVVAIVCANILRQNVNMDPLPTVIGVMCLGAILGTFNGLLVAKISIPDFIVTLATMGIYRALVYILAQKEEGTGVIQNLVIRNNAFGWLGNGKIGPFYVPVYGFVLIALIFYFVLKKTNFGVNVYAVGGNVTAARMSGVNVDRVKILVYTICGFCAGVAGVAAAGRSLTGTTLTGQGMELDVIAAVIVGGTSMAGGRGTILGTVLGTIFIGVLNNGMSLAGVSAYLQPVAKGAVILLAVMIDGWARQVGQQHVAVRAKPVKAKAEV